MSYSDRARNFYLLLAKTMGPLQDVEDWVELTMLPAVEGEEDLKKMLREYVYMWDLWSAKEDWCRDRLWFLSEKVLFWAMRSLYRDIRRIVSSMDGQHGFALPQSIHDAMQEWHQDVDVVGTEQYLMLLRP